METVAVPEDDAYSEDAYQNGVQALQQCPNVQVAESSDIHVGPQLNYHAPVTLNQYVTNTELSDTHTEHQQCQKNNNVHVMCDGRCAAISLLSGILVVVAVCTAIFFFLRSTAGYIEQPPIINTTEPASNTSELHIYSKTAWGSLQQGDSDAAPLLHPTPIVMVSEVRSQSQCSDLSTCSKLLQNLQRLNRTGCNFLVGGDGHLYEERGWDSQSNFPRSQGALVLCFVGDFNKRHLLPSEAEVAQEFLDLGVQLKTLSLHYKLTAHSKLGKYVVQVISAWQHWTPQLNLS